MREILGKAKTVRELLKGVKYSIDYYQREYKWRRKEALELLDDLSGTFLEEFDTSHSRTKVADYPHYFLGSVIVSKKDSGSYLVDGQQRLTTLTLLLILLRNLQRGRGDQVNIDELIVSEKFGQKSFNLHVEERTPCLEALFAGEPFDPQGRSESVQNLHARFCDLEEGFPEEVRGAALPYFADWLLENVHLVEITAYSDDDAYTIFETMNDRGMALSPSDMLKGYLLANIEDEGKRTAANTRWRSRLLELKAAGKEVEGDSFKAWLRSQYAQKIRERKKGAHAEEFERIGTEFHRWLKDSATGIGLTASDDFYRFIDREFEFYSRQYLRLVRASSSQVPGLEHVHYNAQLGFTLQHMVLLSPLTPDDGEQVATEKMAVVARFVDILLAWRVWNGRSIAYSNMQYAMFLVMHKIRRLDLETLRVRLHELLLKETETFATKERLTVNMHNRYSLHRMLARLTDFVETRSGLTSRYSEYVAEGRARYEVEHIWADHPARHTDEFPHPADFADHRNHIGGLLLLPKSFNASYGDKVYAEKLPHYNSQNLLARSLHPLSYQSNPGFLKFIAATGLPFKPHADFKREDIEVRGQLYRQLAGRVWNPDGLLEASK